MQYAGLTPLMTPLKEWNDGPGLYYYGFRFYDPNLQRWLNRDPIQERGGYNQFAIVANSPVNSFDAYGFCDGDNSQPSDPNQPSQIPNFLKNPQNPDPNLLTPADIWPPQGFPPSPFPQQPSNSPLKDFAHQLGNAAKDLYGDQAKQYANNALNNLGIDPSQMGTAEQLGLGTLAGAGAYGLGQSVSYDHNFTKNFSAGFGVSPSGPGFTKPSSCNIHVTFTFP
jgi:RHS repeat-associated protein